jgi:hypothetical protein
VLQAVGHVGRVAMHRHVHGHVDAHTGEDVVVLGWRLGRRRAPGAEHRPLVLRPHAVLRASVSAAGRHHLQQTSCV